jgi:hypothetical protein
MCWMRGRVLWLRWRRFSLDVRLSFFFGKVLVLVLGFSGRGVVTFCIWDGVLFRLVLLLISALFTIDGGILFCF